jgi:hypothetical protein
VSAPDAVTSSPRFIAQRADGLGSFVEMRLCDLSEWPAALRFDPPHFVLFLALDARGISAEAIASFAYRALDSGIAYLVAWGPDCERVHDVFDECIVDREVSGDRAPPGLVMTTWHADDSLEDALEFFALCALPDGREWACTTWLAVSVGDVSRAEEIRTLLRGAPHSAPP